jgi:ATP-dependent Clp protease ATP-binding subunit ClpC
MSTLLALARREAELLGHSQWGAEHILLAALWEGQGVAAQAMRGLDASDAVRSMILARMRSAGYSPGEVSASQLLDEAADEAKRRGDGYIGTEHVLLAMTRSGDIVGAALDDLGLSRALRDRTQNLLEHG